MAKHKIIPAPRALLRDRAYEGLRDLLVAGQVAPGDRLSVRELAASLSISPMPVREAIQRLVAERGLEVRAQSAFRVPLMSRERFEELTTIRVTLEGMAAGLAARAATPDELDAIVAMHRIWTALSRRRYPNPAEVVRANQQLHFAIYAAAHMPLLLNIIEGLWLQVGPVINFDLRTSPTRLHNHAAHSHHSAMVDALVGRNPAAAKRAVIADLEGAAAYILSLDVLPAKAGAA